MRRFNPATSDTSRNSGSQYTRKHPGGDQGKSSEAIELVFEANRRLAEEDVAGGETVREEIGFLTL